MCVRERGDCTSTHVCVTRHNGWVACLHIFCNLYYLSQKSVDI